MLAGLWRHSLPVGSLSPWEPQILRFFPCCLSPPPPSHPRATAPSPSGPTVLPGQREEELISKTPAPWLPSTPGPSFPNPCSPRPAPVTQELLLVPGWSGPTCLLGLWAPGRGFPTTSSDGLSVVSPRPHSLQRRCEYMTAFLSKATRLGDD